MSTVMYYALCQVHLYHPNPAPCTLPGLPLPQPARADIRVHFPAPVSPALTITWHLPDLALVSTLTAQPWATR